MIKSYRYIFLLLTLFHCDEEENKFLHKVLGDYRGKIEYFDDTFPGHTNQQPVFFTVKKHGLNNILIQVDYDLSIPVTKSLISTTGNKIITLGYSKKVTYTSDGVTIECGESDLNNWGEMCGYFNETTGQFYILFTWANGSGNNGAIIRAERVD